MERRSSSTSTRAGVIDQRAKPASVRAIAREYCVLARMTAVANHPEPADSSRRAPASGTDRKSQHRARCIGRLRRQRGVFQVEDDKIGAVPSRDRARFCANARVPPPVAAATSDVPSDRRAGDRAACCAERSRVRCDHSSWRSSANGSMIVFESLPIAERAAARDECLAREACRRRGRPRSSARDRPLRRSAARPRDLAIGHVRRVHDAPARVDVRLGQQPLDRAHATPRDSTRRPRFVCSAA